MSVVTHLSTVQIIFMNRFLVEFLDYLAGESTFVKCIRLLSCAFSCYCLRWRFRSYTPWRSMPLLAGACARCGSSCKHPSGSF
jgi:hypothetical protein